MKHFMENLVTNAAEKLRVITLVMLSFIALGLASAPHVQGAQPASAQPLSGLRVVVDPGHGGYDGGARARDSGVWEKELTLKIALAVQETLSERGAQVTLTRTKDLCLAQEGSGKQRKRADLQKRLDIAAQAGADVFLSIHLNEYRDRAESGPQVFYQHGSDAGRLLAGTLQQALVDTLAPSKVRTANAGDYYVLRNANLPAVLVECGFLSNAAEEQKLLDKAYHRRIAQAVADGLEEWRALRRNVR